MTDQTQTQDNAASLSPEVKKTYERPVLVKLGALRDLTMSKYSSGGKDGYKGGYTGRGGLHSLDAWSS